MLARHLNSTAVVGYGYSRTEAMNLASDYAVDLGLRDKDHPFTLRWLYKFLSRFPELSVKTPRSFESAHARCATRGAISNNSTELNKILSENDLLSFPEAIFNIDEKGLSVYHTHPKSIADAVYKAKAITSARSHTVTLIGGAIAMGNHEPPFFVFLGKRMLPELLHGTSTGAAGVVSETGWSNTGIFSQYIREHLV
ncbi:hypothetical protein DPMN_177652 [Dreissena polymorpha]|uniref:Uncharacterized protein n=1 Tax=Dreissena polymorpha TaxID=45954 RepID=A0A9D4E9E2_DREPO|nr:hypothetical protein DPMN_177652 [Dreissena polymorpha]